MFLQSAGAGGVEAHFIYPAEQSPFRAGIADSSTGPLYVLFRADVLDSELHIRQQNLTGC